MLNLESQGIREDLSVKSRTGVLEMLGIIYKVRYTGAIEIPCEGVKVEVIEFLDDKQKDKMDAALITIDLSKSTDFQRFTGSRVFIDTPIEGKGVWIGVDPEGNFVSFSFDSKTDKEAPSVVYGNGWTGCWIASKSGLKVLEVCVPPYVEDHTVENIKIADKAINTKGVDYLMIANYLRWISSFNNEA